MAILILMIQCPSITGRCVRRFQQFCGKVARRFSFFFRRKREGTICKRSVIFLQGGSRLLEMAIINYKCSFTTLIWLAINVQTEKCITCYFSQIFLHYLDLFKTFFIVFYFINSLLKRKLVKTYYKWILKYLK